MIPYASYMYLSLYVLSRTMKSHSNLSLNNFLQVQKTAGYLTAQNTSCSNGSVFKTRSNVKLLVSWQLTTPILSKFVTWASLIIIIIIAFKGAIRDFLQSPHSAANCLQHARSSGPGAVVCKSRATYRALITRKCHVTCHLVRRDSSAIKFDRVEFAFI